MTYLCKIINVSPVDTKLTTDDLSTVCNMLYSARTTWFNIGLLVEVDNDTLKSIQVRNHEDPDKCLMETFTHRLQAGGPLTWGDLCDCLRSKTVARNDLAEEITEWIKG